MVYKGVGGNEAIRESKSRLWASLESKGGRRNKMIFKALALSGWRPKFSKKLRKKKVVFIDVTFDDFCDED